ncbi:MULTISPECIES: glycosyltransferase family 8 protein [unclassified Mesorhizobium]|uniref:glycosyltransferase family 8 protein n=1 Tax=unclassified Mesorhizobium TaxID=325217 RepID=UPI0030155ECA
MMLIACATDHHYAELAGVMLASLAKNGDSAGSEVVLFGAGLNNRDKKWLRESAGQSIKVIFFDLDGQRLAALRRLRTTRYITAVAYVRMLMPDLLNDRTGRLLYLDCDVVVNHSLAFLREFDLKGLPLAAVRSSIAPDKLAAINAGIGRQADAPYFNSGVLLFDIDEWRRRDLGPRCMDYAANRKGPIHFHDQDVLNHVVGGDWAAIPGTWNRGVKGLSLEECEATAVLHFKGKRKPFHSDFVWPAKQIYDRHRAATPWAARRPVSALRRSLRMRWKTLKGRIRGTVSASAGEE